ncbi:MAG: class II SORL domain-containing protein [Methanosarcinales archaeon]|nr:class II SORL domain-containing protein [Methanosarcinales archaeon]
MTEKNFFNGMNRPVDAVDLTEAEKKHVPVIVSPGSVKPGEPFEVSVAVGNTPHVMEPAHHIQWVELYAREDFLARIAFTPGFTKASATLTVVLEAAGRVTLRVIERCNIHGLWESTRDITVG